MFGLTPVCDKRTHLGALFSFAGRLTIVIHLAVLRTSIPLLLFSACASGGI